MPKIIGEVTLTVDGHKTVAEVCEGNYLILPGQEPGTKGPSLSEADYQRVLDNYEQYEAELKRRRAEENNGGKTTGVTFSLPDATEDTSNIEDEHEASPETSMDSALKSKSRHSSEIVQAPESGQGYQKPAAKRTAEKEAKEPARKKPYAIIAIVVVVALMLATVAFLYLGNEELFRSLIGTEQGPDTYMVAVLTGTIEAGQTIEDGDLGAKEISADEFERIKAATYVQTDADTGQATTLSPSPVLYEDRALIIGLFLTKNYPIGTIITDRMITNQQVVADQYYADIEMPDGTTSQIPLQGATTKGMTEVEIVAIIRNEAGEEIQIPLSTLVLEEKTLLDILDGRGGSILDQMGTEKNEGE